MSVIVSMPPSNTVLMYLRKAICKHTLIAKVGTEVIVMPPPPPLPAQPNQLTWSGEVALQKWTQFYSKVLSKFAANKDLKLKLKVGVVVDGEISEQRLKETKIALQELDLDNDVRSHF